jgi:hypothetical protein
LPIAHLPYSTNFAASTLAEIARFKKAIRDFFKTLEMDCVFVERHVPTKGVQHMHLQCFPVPCSKSMRIAETFVASASKIGINLSRADSTWTVSKVRSIKFIFSVVCVIYHSIIFRRFQLDRISYGSNSQMSQFSGLVWMETLA